MSNLNSPLERIFAKGKSPGDKERENRILGKMKRNFLILKNFMIKLIEFSKDF